MKNNFDFSRISFNASLFVKEMQKRKIKVKFIGDTNVINANYDKHREILCDIHSSLLNYPQGWIINDKFYSKMWLNDHGFRVSPGKFFTGKDQIKKASDYATKLGFPVVLKPTVGSHGDNVYLNIKNRQELEEKIDMLYEKRGGNGNFLIEKHIAGNEYRIFITKNNFFAAVERIPASIIGDGKTNLLLLIQRENTRRMNVRTTCLCEIRLDDITFDFMEKNNVTLDDVPQKGKKIYLRENSNVSTGGNCHDVTDITHPSVKKLANNILNSFPDLPYIGIDLITSDISKKIEPNNYFICELNSAPGLSLHMMPETGISRNVAGALVDLLFPETV
jgi:cyanophycin synthetase